MVQTVQRQRGITVVAKKFLSRAEVATMLGVSPATISRWAREGHLKCGKTVGGHRRYATEDVAQFRGHFFGGQQSMTDTRRRLEKLLEQPEMPDSRQATVIEIRLHGRAGQGLITIGELLAQAALKSGKYFQAFPEFGAERSGSPMETFIRISPDPIYVHAPVLRPHIVMVLDSTLLGHVPVFRGTQERALAVVNFPHSTETLRRAFNIDDGLGLIAVDATAISVEIVKRPFPNIPMLGALLNASPIVAPELMADVIAQGLRRRLSPAMVERNRAAFWEGHKRAQADRAQVSQS